MLAYPLMETQSRVANKFLLFIYTRAAIITLQDSNAMQELIECAGINAYLNPPPHCCTYEALLACCVLSGVCTHLFCYVPMIIYGY